MLYLLFCRNPGSPLSWKQRGMTLTTPSTSLQQPAPVATSCCPASAAPFDAPPWGTSWGTSCGSSTPCDAVVHQTSAAPSTGRTHPLSRRQKKSTAALRPPQPQRQRRESQGLSKSPQSCISQLSPALDPQILVPGIVLSSNSREEK